MNRPRRPFERNKLKRAWIWFWYSNATRLLLVLIPTHLALVLPMLQYFGAEVEVQRSIAIVAYIAVMLWAMEDNDYTQLERIGLDIDRRPLAPVETSANSC